MINFARLGLVVAACVVVASLASGQGRENHDNRGGSQTPHAAAHPQAQVSRPQAQAARPRAPQPLRLAPGAPTRPSGNNMPPAQHFDLHPAPARPIARSIERPIARPETHPESRPAVRTGVRNEVRPVVGRAGARGWGAPDHRSIVASADFGRRAFAHETTERQVGHVYWHADGGQKYAHWYDGNVHWYGFYNGPRFYWTRYEDNRWWWFDQTASRWLSWHDGYWWWHDPANAAAMYVVVNDSYYPYAEVAADPALAPGAAPDDSSSAMSLVDSAGRGVHGNFAKKSPDGSREVQVYGDRREAFLYDLTGGGDPSFIAFLASGVKHVQFSEAAGQNMQIMLLLLDGSYDVFDADGRSVLPSTGNGAPATPSTPGAGAVPADSSSPDSAPPSAPPMTDGSPSNDQPSAPPPIPAQ
jgi:hypothetical protein